jgi:hypothetical protein
VLALGGLIILQDYPAIDADVDGESATLHAKVDPIIRITPIWSCNANREQQAYSDEPSILGIQLSNSKDP